PGRPAMRPLCLLVLVLLGAADRGAGETERVLSAGEEALLRNDFEKSAEHGKRALALAEAQLREGKTPRAYFLPGRAYELLGRHREAVADFTKTIELDSKAAGAYDRRGSEQFKLGRLAESLADFDQLLKLRPDAAPGHWKRGITLYYLGRFDEGQK